MRRLFVSICKALFNALYRLCCLAGRRGDSVLFLSRQANIPSYDFTALAREFERRGWTAVIHVKKLSRRTALSYVVHVLREIRLLSRCKAVVLDRYDPIISLIDFKCESPDATAGSLHREFPVEPVVIQLWHAFGAFKKFGYQSIGTREGHTREVTDAFNIHRNYSWIVCSGEGCRRAFAEAFAYPLERVVALNRPEYDELLEIARVPAAAPDGGLPRVLMAPTLRKSRGSAHPFRDLYERRDGFEREVDAVFSWSFHPLEDGLPAPGDVSGRLKSCDVLVTDYSSIVYEAFLLGKPVLFYVPDLHAYRLSPGLNSDPEKLCPDLVAGDAEDLAAALRDVLEAPSRYPAGQLSAFCAPAFSAVSGRPEERGAGGGDGAAGVADGGTGVAARIADFIIARLEDGA